jgi:hypothetical protein
MLAEIRTSTISIGTREMQNAQNVEMIQKVDRKRSGLAKEGRRRPFAAAIISLRQRCKTAYVVPPLHGS